MGKKGTPHRKWSKEEKRKISGQFSMPSHGDHRLARDVSLETGWVFSHNLAHKCCKAAGIHSRARKGRYRRTGEESILFPNQVRGHWNAAAPLQLVVSDMTILADVPGNLTHRPGSCLLFKGFLPGPSRL